MEADQPTKEAHLASATAAAAEPPASATPADFQPANKCGAPAGNRNHLKHGTSSFLMTGRLPPGASYIRRAIGRLRVELETAVRNQNGGELSVYHAALVQSALRHEARACLLTRYLRLMGNDRKTTTNRATNKKTDGDKTAVSTIVETEGGTLADRMALLREISAASDSRDKCLEKLKLDRDGKTNVLDAAWALADELASQTEPPAVEPPDASEATPDALRSAER